MVLLGPPGCGKGTQAEFLEGQFGLVHLSTGDLLRDALARGTAAGIQAKEFMAKGLLVPDSIVLEIVSESIKSSIRGGFILDGFPRNLNQAKALDALLAENNLALTHVVLLEVPAQVLKKRICGRLVHPASGRSYHTGFCPPRIPNRDDVTGEELVRRPDDTEEALEKRLGVYESQTRPLIEHYSLTSQAKKSKLRLVRIDASLGPQEVSKRLAAALSPSSQ